MKSLGAPPEALSARASNGGARHRAQIVGRGLLALALAVGALLLGVRWIVARPAGGVSATRWSQPPPARRGPSLSFAEAVRRLDVEAVESAATTPAERQMGEALRAVAAGELAAARAPFEALRADGPPELARQAAEGLVEVLRALGAWAEVAALLGEMGDDAAHGDLVAARAFATAPQASFRWPVEPVAAPLGLVLGIPTVATRIGSCRRSFLVDTGAALTVLADDTAAECGVEPIGDEVGRMRTSNDHSVAFRPAVIGQMALAGLELTHHPAVIVSGRDLALGPLRFAGIVGWPALSHGRVEIDYDRQLLTLGESQPTREERNLLWLGHPLVRSWLPDGSPLLVGLATGARTSSLRQRFLEHIALSGVRERNGIGAGSGGARQVVRANADNLEVLLAGWRLRFARIATIDGAGRARLAAPDGSLGGDVATVGRVAIDYPAGRFDLEPPLR